MPIRKIYKAAAFLGMAGLLGAGVYFFLFDKNQLPPKFLESRREAAMISQAIVNLTDNTNQKIKAINLEDLNGNIETAIKLIREARESNAQAYAKSSALARHLQQLAESLTDLKSKKLQQEAYEAVAVELSLVSEFIGYTQTINNFFDSLSRAIVTDSFADRRAVQERLQEVNYQVEKINNLNKEFLIKINKFDKSFN
jgi:hypothetical protein